MVQVDVTPDGKRIVIKTDKFVKHTKGGKGPWVSSVALSIEEARLLYRDLSDLCKWFEGERK